MAQTRGGGGVGGAHRGEGRCPRRPPRMCVRACRRCRHRCRHRRCALAIRIDWTHTVPRGTASVMTSPRGWPRVAVVTWPLQMSLAFLYFLFFFFFLLWHDPARILRALTRLCPLRAFVTPVHRPCVMAEYLGRPLLASPVPPYPTPTPSRRVERSRCGRRPASADRRYRRNPLLDCSSRLCRRSPARGEGGRRGDGSVVVVALIQQCCPAVARGHIHDGPQHSFMYSRSWQRCDFNHSSARVK